MVYRPTSAVQNKPTHLTLQTHPMLIPVNMSHENHSMLKLLSWSLWNLAQQSTVVNVKHRSMESSKMNLLIVV